MKLKDTAYCYFNGKIVKKVSDGGDIVYYDHIVLPYTQLQYVYNTSSSQWFDTGIAIAQDLSFEVQFYGCSQSSSWGAFFGVSRDSVVTDWANTIMMRWGSNTQLEWSYQGDNTTPEPGRIAFTSVKPTNTSRTYKFQSEAANSSTRVCQLTDLASGTTEQHQFNTSPLDPNYYQGNIYMFTFNRAGSAYTSRWQAVKLISFKVWKAGTLIADYLPVRRTSDSKVCLYDQVTQTYKVPQSGSWSPGPIAV